MFTSQVRLSRFVVLPEQSSSTQTSILMKHEHLTHPKGSGIGFGHLWNLLVVYSSSLRYSTSECSEKGILR